MLWGFMRILPAFLKFNVAAIDQLPKAASDTMAYIVDQLVKNENLIFMMIVCSGVVLVVYLLNKISMNYMRYISLVIGTLVGIICFIVGKVVGMTDLGIFAALLVPVLSLAILIIMEFFHMALNYQMSQRLAFADDEYYYYVRAIPKILGIRGKTEVKTITTGQAKETETVAETVQAVSEEESAGEKITGEFSHTTQQIGKLFADMGGKAKDVYKRQGDYLTAGGGRQSLKKFMINQKIALDERDRIPLVADGAHILWIVGYRLSDSCRVGPDSERIVRIHYYDEENPQEEVKNCRNQKEME